MRAGMLVVFCTLATATLPVASRTSAPASRVVLPFAHISALGTRTNSGFGSSIALSADASTLVVGAPRSGTGKVYIYSDPSQGWQAPPRPTTITEPYARPGDEFGS